MTTQIPALRYVPSSELETGQIVWTHGMRCEIDREVRAYRGHNGADVYATNARVTNVEDVLAAGVVPAGFLDRDADGARRWTIQGNDLVTWAVEA